MLNFKDTINASITGNAATATKATTADKTKAALTIQRNGTTVGSSFDGAIARTINITVPTKVTDLTDNTNYIKKTDYASASAAGVIKLGTGLTAKDGVVSVTGSATADSVEWAAVKNAPTKVSYWTNDSGYITLGNVMAGATASTAGKAGVVPAPGTGSQAKFLRGDGQWADVSYATTAGSATSATKLQTARNITIGNTTKSFNGTNDINWTLKEIGAYPLRSTKLTTQEQVDEKHTNGIYSVEGIVPTGLDDGTYYYVSDIGEYSNGNYRTQLAFPYQDVARKNTFYIRTQKGTEWQPWHKVVTEAEGTATNATKATNDSDGNKINSTYLKLSGGTMTGILTVPRLVISDTTMIGHITFNRNNYNYIHANKTNGSIAFVTNGKTINGANSDLVIDGAHNAVMPGDTDVTSLGASDKKWKNVYATKFNGSLVIPASAGKGILSVNGLPILSDYGNNNVVVNAASGVLYLGYQNTTSINILNGKATIDANGNYSKNAATATKLQTARTINGVSFDGTKNITVADSTKLPLSGGTVTGRTIFNQGTSVKMINAGAGTQGYFRVCTFNINSSYQNQFIVFHLSQRSRYGTLYIKFASANPKENTYIEAFMKDGNIPTARLVRTADATYDLYILKSEGYDNLEITQIEKGSYMDPTVITWVNQCVTTLPSTTDYPEYKDATWRELANNAASATKLQTARKINGVSFNGTADITIPVPTIHTGSGAPASGTGKNGDIYIQV